MEPKDFMRDILPWMIPLICSLIGVGYYVYLNGAKTEYVIDRINNGECIEHSLIIDHEYRIKRVEEFCCNEILRDNTNQEEQYGVDKNTGD